MGSARPMHILIIPAWLEPEVEGHTGVFIREQAREIANSGAETGILYIQEGGQGQLRITDHNYREWYGNMSKAKTRLTRLRYTYYSYYTFYSEYIRTFGRPDIIHSHGLYALPAANYLSRRTGIPLVHTEHLRALMDPVQRYYRLLARYLYRWPRRIIAVSEAHLDAIRPLTGNKELYIPNMLNRAYFEAPVNRPNISGTYRFLTVSDLDKIKGHQLIMEALSLIKKEGLNFHWAIIGDGPERTSLEAAATSLGLADRVTFHGKKSRAEILALSGGTTLYVSASKLESFGLHIAEAIAAGIFTVTYQSIGATAFQNAQNSIVFDDYSPGAAAAAIKKGLVIAQNISPQDIRNSVSGLLHPDLVIAQLKKVYEEVGGND